MISEANKNGPYLGLVTPNPFEMNPLLQSPSFTSFNLTIDFQAFVVILPIFTENYECLSNLEVWFQRPKDIVRKLVSGDLDLGIVGLDTVSEYRQGNEDLVLVHDALEFGDCRLSLAMGIVEAIVDLVSSGTTLRENNLKEIEGGVILQSQAVLVASKKSLTQRKGVLDITHEILERLEAHLRAIGQFTGPTISPIFCKRDGRVAADYYAIVICVPKKLLYKSVQQLRAIGGSGVLISPLTYIFDEETPR
ncbi:hypothetical protein TEA_030139 [Camellia sinensis var. sinensis]|uniref:ATP phosphoribosyltransferase n=1 Tax=Camellia sinensis var. sinensis TaxID=542762 RepID=A0A4S4EM55_CAMSN|nr:hypothetical protein TEA_030139 [Camellia sinensis var. sinensis]